MRTSLAIIALFVTGTAFADVPDLQTLRAQGPQALMQAVDARHNHYPTQKWEFRMVVQAPGGTARQMEFNVWQKERRRLVRFTAPGELRGMSVLSKGDGPMWVYSQETGGQARLVATSARRQTLLGSDLTYNDMAQIDFSADYTATFGDETTDYLWLQLTPIPDHDTGWDGLRLRLNKGHMMFDRIEYQSGGRAGLSVVKVQERSNFAVLDNAPVYQHVVVTTSATGHQTTVDMLSQRIGEEISNRVFTKRSLVRGN